MAQPSVYRQWQWHRDGQNLTGLIWVKAPHHLRGNADAMTCNHAIHFCNGLNHAGYFNWTLPNRFQLERLLDLPRKNPALPQPQLFVDVQSDYYWSDTSLADGTSAAWFVYLYFGSVGYDGKSSTFSVWPVRAGQ